MTVKEQIEKRGYAIMQLTANGVKDTEGPMRFSIIAVCHQGSFTGTANLMPIELHAGTRVCLPDILQITVGQMSDDFTATLLAVSPKLALDVTVGIPSERLEYIFGNPVRFVSDEHELELLKCQLDSITHYVTFGTHECEGCNVVACIIRSILLAIAEMELRHSENDPAWGVYSIQDIYYRKFIHLLNKHVEMHHEVQFYADKIGMSPKYLNAIAKRKTGHKAKEVISSILLSRIKRDLLLSTVTMQELADKFNFADISSLGKFFKKMTGLSPRNYRAR